MNPIDGGDEYLSPLNMAPIGSTDTDSNTEQLSEEASARLMALAIGEPN